jgi:nucleoside-diphosphate-sugar epimerase
VTPSSPSILVVSATSLVGRYLLPLLREAGWTVHAVSRRPPADQGAATASSWVRADVAHDALRLPPAEAAVHLAPLWLAPPIVDALADAGVRRLIAFGSTSRWTKADSADLHERELSARLARAEEDLQHACERRAIAWTIFRPTLTYGGGRDKNVTAIARWARRLRIVPIAGSGRGLRQPVHAADLAAACVRALASPAAHGRAYDVGGGTVLSYREMVAEVCRATGGARVVSVPAPLLRSAARVVALLSPLRGLSGSMVDRMEQDLVVDDGDARRDLGYRPRAFAYPDGRPPAEAAP